jgi:hypothetical protein
VAHKPGVTRLFAGLIRALVIFLAVLIMIAVMMISTQPHANPDDDQPPPGRAEIA